MTSIIPSGGPSTPSTSTFVSPSSCGPTCTNTCGVEMNYWPSLVTGLSDLVTPLNNLLKTKDKRGQEVARRMYNASGTVTHHNTDLWGDSAPQDDYIPGTFWPM